ncbi:Aldose 1-epimerase [Pseudoalteromonas luteoviolacea B = ATCC 29581]|nr:Aldose 1-epimerase [Pseudoalteromonas luteoviolacea B = ATCC 29581]
MQLPTTVSKQQMPSGLTYLKIDSALCSATIFLQGAQLTEFTPKGQAPLIWVSSDEDYQLGKPVRGGIPICWPWFGVHPDSTMPIHGVARKLDWQLEQVEEHNDTVIIRLSLSMSLVEEKYWPHKSELRVEFVLSDTLRVNLINKNVGTDTFMFTQALHTYFPTSDIKKTFVDGLQGAQYIEFGEGPYAQSEHVHFARETDMVYTEVKPVQWIHTPEGIIEVAREHSSSCVLWNPWIEKAKRLSNFKNDEYLTMLCLEATNVMNDAVSLAPNETHTLSTMLRWK